MPLSVSESNKEQEAERIIVIMKFSRICTTGYMAVERNYNWMTKARIAADFKFGCLVAKR